MSRTHPGTSSAYIRKVQRRKERARDRELLRRSKLMHYELYGRDAPIDRVKIRKFKRQFLKQVNEGSLVLHLDSE